jgi:nicotinate phosphoribosyltransferase
MTARTRKLKSVPKRSSEEKEQLDELLDEGLKETFPASDPLAILEPVHGRPGKEGKPEEKPRSATKRQR